MTHTAHHRQGTYHFYGAQCSWFSAKIRSYLLRKSIPFVEKVPTIWQYQVTLPRRAGSAAIPVIVTPEGQWLSDSSEIIDVLEQRSPARPVVPQAPVARLVAYLVEMWADEFWYPAAMMSRWYHPENYVVFEQELGPGFLPGAPAFLQRAVTGRVAGMLRSYLPKLGVTPAKATLIERWTATQLDALDAHFAQQPYLLGGAHTLADFALMGPLYAHMGRDPWSQRELIAPRRHLHAWMTRMNQFEPGDGAGVAAGPAPTLVPMLRSMLQEMLPYIGGVLDELRRAASRAGANPVPRYLGPVTFPFASQTLTRDGMGYILWMVQRARDAIGQMSALDQQIAGAWLREMGGDAFLQLDIPRVERAGLTVRLAGAAR